MALVLTAGFVITHKQGNINKQKKVKKQHNLARDDIAKQKNVKRLVNSTHKAKKGKKLFLKHASDMQNDFQNAARLRMLLTMPLLLGNCLKLKHFTVILAWSLPNNIIITWTILPNIILMFFLSVLIVIRDYIP